MYNLVSEPVLIFISLANIYANSDLGAFLISCFDFISGQTFRTVILKCQALSFGEPSNFTLSCYFRNILEWGGVVSSECAAPQDSFSPSRIHWVASEMIYPLHHMSMVETDIVTAVTHPKHLLHLGNAFDKYSSQLVTNSCQQKSKEWNAKNWIEDAENLPSFCAGSNVSIAWSKERRLQIWTRLDHRK